MLATKTKPATTKTAAFKKLCDFPKHQAAAGALSKIKADLAATIERNQALETEVGSGERSARIQAEAAALVSGDVDQYQEKRRELADTIDRLDVLRSAVDQQSQRLTEERLKAEAEMATERQPHHASLVAKIDKAAVALLAAIDAEMKFMADTKEDGLDTRSSGFFGVDGYADLCNPGRLTHWRHRKSCAKGY